MPHQHWEQEKARISWGGRAQKSRGPNRYKWRGGREIGRWEKLQCPCGPKCRLAATYPNDDHVNVRGSVATAITSGTGP